MAKLEDILKTTSQREDLDELCNIIFGSDFEEMMKTRYMSYDELDEQRRELQDSVGKLSSEMEKVTKKFAEAVESRVPVDLIETQLLRLDPSTASAIFGNLHEALEMRPNDSSYHKRSLFFLNYHKISLFCSQEIAQRHYFCLKSIQWYDAAIDAQRPDGMIAMFLGILDEVHH